MAQIRMDPLRFATPAAKPVPKSHLGEVQMGHVAADATSEGSFTLAARVGAEVYGVSAEVYGVGPEVYGIGAEVYGVGAEVYGVGAGVYGVGAGVYGVGAGVYGVGAEVYGVDAEVYEIGAEVYGVGAEVYEVGAEVYRFGGAGNQHLEPLLSLIARYQHKTVIIRHSLMQLLTMQNGGLLRSSCTRGKKFCGGKKRRE
ncbi:hypothetical protein BIW11_03569 [Tropilaelaps mercedesae]|uniref:Uncharacterized protein n=1 Tax=Tropilaelaps mercedesae TaxID=418985 RepID=A0A1V9XJD6_9ACAR|nr:hypothetical protein BIW11_03569 [Tropilaelaps mercedesae]